MLNGNPTRFHDTCQMDLPSFEKLLDELENAGLKGRKHIKAGKSFLLFYILLENLK
ncbi:hypothetical protein HK096_001070, partial [Nowakowskiella sp. JEL0078]